MEKGLQNVGYRGAVDLICTTRISGLKRLPCLAFLSTELPLERAMGLALWWRVLREGVVWEA
jgi:hypothetical protein